LQDSSLDLVLFNIFIDELNGGLDITPFGMLKQQQMYRDYLEVVHEAAIEQG